MRAIRSTKLRHASVTGWFGFILLRTVTVAYRELWQTCLLRRVAWSAGALVAGSLGEAATVLMHCAPQTRETTARYYCTS